MASIQPQNIVIGFTPVAKLIRMNAKFIIAFNALFIQIRFEWLRFSLSGTLMRSSSTKIERVGPFEDHFQNAQIGFQIDAQSFLFDRLALLASIRSAKTLQRHLPLMNNLLGKM